MGTRPLLPGNAEGRALVLDEPLSLWGGYDPATGEIIDRRHPQSGENAAGRVLVMPVGKGSSSASSVLAEAIRAGTAPRAIVLAEPDDIVLLGAMVAEELYGVTCPVIVTDDVTYPQISTDDLVRIDAEGVEVQKA